MKNLWMAFVAAGLLIAVVYGRVVDADSRLGWYSALAVAALAATVFGIVMQRVQPVFPWVLLVGGFLSFVIGDVVYWIIEQGGPPAFPSLADIWFLAAYPLFFSGVLLLSAREDEAVHSVGAAAGVAAGLLHFAAAWNSFASQIWSADAELAASAVATAYPLFDSMLLGALVYFAFALEKRQTHHILVALSGLTFVLGNWIYNIALNDATFEIGGTQDIFWLGAFVLLAAAAQSHPERSDKIEQPQSNWPVSQSS